VQAVTQKFHLRWLAVFMTWCAAEENKNISQFTIRFTARQHPNAGFVERLQANLAPMAFIAGGLVMTMRSF